jgi:hypothetical protein
LDMLVVVERLCCGCGCEVCFVVGERVGAAQEGPSQRQLAHHSPSQVSRSARIISHW